MKHILLAFFALSFSISAGAQLKADAGADQIWCRTFKQNDGPTLGGLIVANHGTPPYTYMWWELYSPYPATSILDSITSEHPTVMAKSPPEDSLLFVLEVTDALSNKAYDTVRVYISNWICPLGENVISKAAADTVRLSRYECRSAFGPNVFLYWTTSDYLEDSTVYNTRCWVPFSKQYTGIYMNQIGCRDSMYCYVEVRPTRVPGSSIAQSELLIYPNPVSTDNRIVCGEEWLGGRISFFSVDGRLLTSLILNDRGSSFHFEQPAGVYFYRAVSANGTVQSGKLTKE